jgi:hypothetical protein
MKVWLLPKGNINTQIDKNWCYKTIMHCLNLTKIKYGVQWGCILSNGQCYWKKQLILTFTFHSFWCFILGITFHNFRNEANSTSLPELMHRYFWGILKIQIKWKLHLLSKNWKTLSEQKLIIFRDEISIAFQDKFPEFARPH